MRPGRDEVILGRISGPFGVRGWVRIESFTEPATNVLHYTPWRLRVHGEWRECRVLEGRRHGAAVVARLEGCSAREDARALGGAEIAVPRARLPDPQEGDYYWSDLLGLRVRTVQDVELGEVRQLMPTGANDVLVVEGERERLIPFVIGAVVTEVDLGAGTLVVDWDPDF